MTPYGSSPFDPGVVYSFVPAGDYLLSVWATRAPQVILSPESGPVRLTPARVASQPAVDGYFLYQLRFTASGTGWPAVTLVVAADGTGDTRIDELRLHPAHARMTSYTHEPLVGVTAVSDPAGRVTTYEYDQLGRLVRVRGHAGQVLSEHEYRYGRQP